MKKSDLFPEMFCEEALGNVNVDAKDFLMVGEGFKIMTLFPDLKKFYFIEKHFTK